MLSMRVMTTKTSRHRKRFDHKVWKRKWVKPTWNQRGLFHPWEYLS